ncbi:hypothetical protein LJB42_003925 [Komagataella kurtzmanii]|nr:hypothetical protein LJB42_003925 [Komagataella kurtzmanii]
MSPKEKETPKLPKEKDVEQKESNSKKKIELPEDELSEEDAALKGELEMLVERLQEDKVELYQPGIDSLKKFIKESTSSMTAVPKPLKFLRSHYDALISVYGKWEDKTLKAELADVLSMIGMTYNESDNKDGVETYKRESLKWRLLGNLKSLNEWGHEYLRHLSLEIGEQYQEDLEFSKEKDEKLFSLALEIVPEFLKHNAETEAVDLLLELESIDKLPQFVDKDTFERVCLYLVSCVPLLAPPDDLSFLNTAFSIYLLQNQLTNALSLAIRLDDEELIRNVFEATDDEIVQQQLGFILGRQNSCFKIDNEKVQQCISNVKISEYFKYLTKELNLLTPKVPEDIYRSHLESSPTSIMNSSMESAHQNLASAFVNSFVNAGYGSEKVVQEDQWIYKTKGTGMLSTTASLGLINLWDNTEGLQKLDEYLYNEQSEIKAGALLGMGLSSTSVHDEVESALLILQDYLSGTEKNVSIITSVITGLGISFAGSEDETVLNLLLPLISDTDISLEVSSLAALALGHVFVGTCNGDISSTILQTLLERESSELTSKWIRFMSLGLGLLYMSKYDQADDVLETIEAIEHPIVKTLKVIVTVCSYAGTGNVLQIQALLQMCTVKPHQDEAEEDEEKDGEKGKESENDKDKEDIDNTTTPENESYQAYAVLGLALIAMGEEIGQEMSLRHFGHLMHYGNSMIRRAVPLAMGLVSSSNPQMKVFDTLSRYSHDQDLDVAINSIFSMGLVGAGTNNARLAQLLRQLASYYSKDRDSLFIVRIAQGLVSLGKGTMTISPFNTDRAILSKVSLASILTVAVTLLDPKSFILDNNSALLYYLAPSIKPRMLVTVDEELNPIKVNVRVGQAVDVVGQAGRPKTITGWVTHSTPVLLGHGERAELETDEYLSLATALEGIVILRKNPDFVEED